MIRVGLFTYIHLTEDVKKHFASLLCNNAIAMAWLAIHLKTTHERRIRLSHLLPVWVFF